MKEEIPAVIFFDGVCNLCNRLLQFIIKHDRKKYFRFAALQSDSAKKMLTGFSISASASETILLLEEGKLYKKSTAVLRIAKKLDGPWKAFDTIVIVPVFIRDFFYGIIAKKRYNWFGKRDYCMAPENPDRERFVLDGCVQREG